MRAVERGEFAVDAHGVEHVARDPRRLRRREGARPHALAGAQIDRREHAGMARRVDDAAIDHGTAGDVVDRRERGEAA